VIFERTTRFKRAAKKLTSQDRERLAKALVLYEADPSHPSLGIKRVQGTKDIWEGRASDAVRFTFEKIDRGILLRNVGSHDPTLKRP
jgi:mRNA-degrading endonuclease RelE of RelBE toxin-antitoxin system